MTSLTANSTPVIPLTTMLASPCAMVVFCPSMLVTVASSILIYQPWLVLATTSSIVINCGRTTLPCERTLTCGEVISSKPL